MPKTCTTSFIDDVENEKLILAVEEFPCLWDPSKESYRKSLARNIEWSKVADLCNKPGQGKFGYKLTSHEQCTAT